MLTRIFKILDAQWLIHRDTALSYVPLFIAFLNGQKIDITVNSEQKKINVAGYSPGEGSENSNPIVRWYELNDPDLPENSVAVIPVDGVICSWDTSMIIQLIRIAESNSSINSIILMVNSPGGMVAQVDILSETIKTLSKPTVAIISGMAASSAMWIISGASYRIATSRMDMIGSIGTKTSIQDMTGMLEKIGIKITDLYATKATRKDEEFRKFIESKDTAPMLAVVDFINEIFHESIQKNLGIGADSEVFTGAIYFAEKAKELGLIDEINTLDYAVQHAYQLGLKNKIIQYSKQLKLNK